MAHEVSHVAQKAQEKLDQGVGDELAEADREQWSARRLYLHIILNTMRSSLLGVPKHITL